MNNSRRFFLAGGTAAIALASCGPTLAVAEETALAPTSYGAYIDAAIQGIYWQRDKESCVNVNDAYFDESDDFAWVLARVSSGVKSWAKLTHRRVE